MLKLIYKKLSDCYLEPIARSRIFSKTWEAATGGVLLEKVFSEISQNSQGNTCVRVALLV